MAARACTYATLAINDVNLSGENDFIFELDTARVDGPSSSMSYLGTRPIHLRRIDDAQSMMRFYGVSVELTLFGTPASPANGAPIARAPAARPVRAPLRRQMRLARP